MTAAHNSDDSREDMPSENTSEQNEPSFLQMFMDAREPRD